MNNITAKVELITPDKAAALFEAVPDYQRNLRPIKVAQYASDIELGLWSLNGEPLIIASNGDLIDGQHRIAAIIKANKPVQMMVVRGVEPESYKTIDKGMARKAADGLKGVPNAGRTAVIAKVWGAYNKTGNAYEAINGKTMTQVQVQEYALANLDAIQGCCSRYGKIIGQLGHLSTIGYAAFEIFNARKYSPMDVEQFAAEVAKGAYSTEPAIQMLIHKILQGGLSAGGGIQIAKKTVQLFSYAFEKWYTGSKATSKCYFETFNLSKFDYDAAVDRQAN